MVVQLKDAEYSHVPTPKELELSRQLVEFQQDKDQREQKLLDQIADLKSQVHKLQVRINDISQTLQATKREQIYAQQLAVEEERNVWRAKVDELHHELNQEKHDKDAQQKWQLKFVVASAPKEQVRRRSHGAPQPIDDTSTPATAVVTAPVVDPADDVFAKFAQHIALLPASSAQKVTKAGVLPFLTHLLREDLSDLVTGSVLLALVHLAINGKPQRLPLHRRSIMTPEDQGDDQSSLRGAVNVKDEIVKAGAATPLVLILDQVQNPRVAVEAARLCAALASHIPNKRVLAAKNAIRFLTLLLVPAMGSSSRSNSNNNDASADRDSEAMGTARMEKLPLPGDEETQKTALSALVNLSYDSEVLRSQIVNFNFLPVAVRYLRESVDLGVRAEAAKLLGNLACNHIVNQSAVITCEGDVALAKCLTAENLQKSPELIRACAIGIANLAYTSVNQLSIGYGDAMTLLLQLAVDSTNPQVLEAVLSAISCLCHQNPLNKGRVAAQNGLQVLLYVISQSKRFGHDESALVAACECFAVVANTKANRHQVLELDGHLPICRLSKKATSGMLLEASASAVCALIPSPSERAALLADSRESKLETNRIGLSALERARHLLTKQQTYVVPSWLTTGIHTLTGYTANSGGTASEGVSGSEDADTTMATEFHERSYFSLESLTEIMPDELCPHFYDQ